MTEYRSKIGPEGQVVIVKELGEKHGLKEGGLVEQISMHAYMVLCKNRNN